jgi:hypothetical protein
MGLLISDGPMIVIPSRRGTDLSNSDGTEDAHIRIEKYEQIDTTICVDRFDSAIRDANKAHIVLNSFSHSNQGAEEATQYLQKHGFRVAVIIK